MNRNFLIPAAFTSLALAGCVSLNGADRSAPPEVPGMYEFAGEDSGVAPSTDWWASFGDPQLDTLIEEAMRDNLDLEAGLYRLAQARASLRVANAVLYPTASGGASVSGNYSDSSMTDDFNTSSSGRLSVQYDVDLFGANKAGVTSARAGYRGQEYSYKALQLATQAETAVSYFNLLAARERLSLARRNLDFLEQIMELVSFRYQEGAVSGADMARQKSAVASARAQIPQLLDALNSAEQSLSILLGNLPQDAITAQGEMLSVTAPSIDAGLPADLLLRRPDLLIAQANLAAADADVAAARAAFFPSIDLSAALSSSLDGDGDPSLSLASGLTAPLFTGGRLQGGLDRTKARFAELEASYRQAILIALGEVDAALLGQRLSQEREEQLRIAVEQADRALEIATVQYRNGATGLLDLLDAQRSRLSAEDSLISARLAALSEAVNLYRALGGGWQASVASPDNM